MLTGHDEVLRSRLQRTFAGDARVRVLGFTDRMSDLLAAADAIIHSTAGLTILEAHMCGCVPISYGWGVGHIRVNNRAFVRHGLAEVASSAQELDQALDRALAQRPLPDRSLTALPSAAASVLALVSAGAALRGTTPGPARLRSSDRRGARISARGAALVAATA